MRIPSGTTNRYIYFVAVDPTDLKTRETALSTFTVYYEINNGTATAMTTPTVTESDATNMPGVYSLLIDESGMTALTAGHDTAELCLHITHGSMAPVTRVIEIYRVKMTEGELATVANNAIDADVERFAGTVGTFAGGRPEVNVSHWNDTAVPAEHTAGYPIVTIKDGTGTGEINTNAGAVALVDLVTTTTTATTATNVTTVNGLAANVITATSIAADAITDAKVAADVTIASVTGAVGSVTGAVGSVTGNVGGNVVGSVASVTAGVTLAASAVQAIWDALTSALTAAGSIGKLLVDNINATISSRLATASYTAPLDAAGTRSAVGLASANLDTQLGDLPTGAEITDLVWDEATSGHTTAGTTGKALIDAGAAGDPWGTALPGAYGAGTAGKIVGDNLNATVSSRSSHSAADVWAAGTRTLTSFGTLVTDITTAVWAAATRTLTAFGFTPTPSNAADTTAILADTNELQTDWANGGRLDVILDARASQTSVDDLPTNAELTTALDAIPTANENADALLKRDWTAVTGEAARSVLNALRFLRNKWSITGTTATITKEDDATTAWTSELTAAAGSDPISGSDPS